MSTLPDRLEKAYVELGQHYGYVACIDEAADRIRTLEAALKRIRHAFAPADFAYQVADEALSVQP